tara:strand:- start:6222 stop:8039 length:1818 start_codon:yes stop_codon:yes gene_type:complete
MKRINFNHISIRNFLSIGNEPVKINFTPGLHIITGINRDKPDRQNGIGKTSVVESIYFAIFGKTIRDIRKDLIANNCSNESCEVILDFNVDELGSFNSYTVTRTLNPTKLYLYKNGKDETRDTMKSTEAEIANILSATPSIFENCVVMTLNGTIPFMAKSKIEKRKFIEGIFNLEIFSEMLLKVRDNFSSAKRVYEIELTKLEEQIKSYNILDERKQNTLKSQQDKVDEYTKRQLNNSKEIESLILKNSKYCEQDVQDVIKELSKYDDGIIKCDQKIERLNEVKLSNNISATQKDKEIKNIGTNKDKCPVCLRSITEHDINHINSEKQTLIEERDKFLETVIKSNSDIELTRSQKLKIKAHLNKLQDRISQIKIENAEKVNNEKRIEQLTAWQIQLKEDITNINNTNTEFDDILLNLNKEIDNIKNNSNKYRTHLNLLETVKYIVSEEGVKTYIVNKILELFNSKISLYLKKMDSNCSCYFNELFEEEIINDKNKISSYFNFSGAERKNIDFACLFTFMDMRRLQGNVSYNISIYDELFDSSLDEKGVDIITNILKERVQTHNECVMIISHRKESVNIATGEVIFLEKRDGITTRLDYNEQNVNT